MLNHNYVLPLLALLLGMLLPLAYAETGKETYTLTWADAPPLVVASESSDETDVPSMDDVPKSSGETDVPSMDGVPEFSESSDVLPDPDTLTLTGSDTSPVDTLPTNAILTPEQILANLTLREKVGQLFIVRPEKLSFTYDSTDGEPVRVDGGKTALTDVMRAAYTRYPVGGFVLFADNIEDPSQLRQFLTDLNSLCPVTPFLAVDEEGGNVARLANKASLGIDNVGSMGSIGGKGDTDLAFTAGATIGSYLSDYVFTLDFTPVADLQGPVIGNRSFGTDPESVSLMVGSFIDGLHSEGIMSCLKHFPGLGSSVSDTHEGTAEIEKTGGRLAFLRFDPVH